MHADLLPVEHVCEACRRNLQLRYRSDRCTREWHQGKRACMECKGKTKPVTAGTVLEGENWLNFLGAFCMWTFGYPPSLIQREVGVDHKRLLQWEQVWHEGVEADLQTRLASSTIAAAPPQSANRTRGVKRLAAASKQQSHKKVVQKKIQKRPASMKNLKRPAAANFSPKKQSKTPDSARFFSRYKYVIEVGESHLNKAKAGDLTCPGRIQNDQVWVWGDTIPKQPDRFVFRVLQHPCRRCL